TMANLDVTMENNDLTFNLITPNNTSDPNVIRVTNSKLPNVRLASYLDDNPKFAGQLHCEALTGDERANRLCGGLLQGQELTSANGYTGYLLDQEIDQTTCGFASKSWSTSKTKCYKDTASRCQALGVDVISGQADQCGYTDTKSQTLSEEIACVATKNFGCDYSIIEAGGICQTTRDAAQQYQCQGSTIKQGGKCVGEVAAACHQSTIENGGICEVPQGGAGCKELKAIQAGGVCVSYANVDSAACNSAQQVSGAIICNATGKYCGSNSTFNGGVCVTNADSSACWKSTLTNGSVCYANIEGSRCDTSKTGHVSYNDTSCCCGDYCGNAPTCSAERCSSVRAQYAQYFE
ncbi:MAG: hypothetical protein IKN49_02925, partial [Elusimicrobiaceae bacterium]|nr:hypothetical protein [Elusimicrobiaceae bacterium]